MFFRVVIPTTDEHTKVFSNSMAIPKLYSIIQGRWPDTVAVANGSSCKCECLYIDMGSILHSALHRTQDQDGVYKALKSYIGQIVSMAKPTVLIYVALDGVPPVSKLKEQAMRRKMSKTSGHGWNPHELTPGSELMHSIAMMLAVYCETLSQSVGVTVILDDCYCPGEGEQKIITHIKGFKRDSRLNIVIYSSDADMIAMTVLLRDCNVYLLRETPNSRKKMYTQKRFEQLNIGKLQTRIGNIRTTTEKPLDSKLHAFAIASMILGNDFLKTPLGYGVSYPVLIDLIDSLCCCVSDDNAVLDWAKFFDNMARREYSNFKEEYPLDEGSKREIILSMSLQSLSLKEKKNVIKEQIDDVERENFLHWRERKYLFESISIATAQLAQITEDYIKGLELLHKYYQGDNAALSSWLFGHSYVPMFSDMAPHVHDFGSSAAPVVDDTLLKPIHVLALVLPRSSSHLLPKVYRTDAKIEQNDIFTMQLTELFDLTNYMKLQLDPFLDEEEKLRNIEGNIQIFSPSISTPSGL